MPKTTTNQFGTFSYDPTPLEEFVETLAAKWSLKWPGLDPYVNFRLGLVLRVCTSDGLRDGAQIGYTRIPSLRARMLVIGPTKKYLEKSDKPFIPHIYAENPPEGEYVHLTKDGKQVTIAFTQNGVSEVSIGIRENDEDLTRAAKYSNYSRIIQKADGITYDFNKSPRNGIELLSCMRSAINLARDYFKVNIAYLSQSAPSR